ncbi:MAG: DNA primase [Rubripirellula sp.]
MSITDFDLKERVRSATDIVDVIGATLELHPRGRDFLARCPWHNDKRPSLTVNQERQTWKCWPCDVGGDVFSFVMRRDGVEFPVALRTLAELAGIEVPEFGRAKKAQPGSPEDRDTLFAAMKLVNDSYFELLDSASTDDAKIARDYLDSRGVSEECRKRFQIGFSPDSWSYAVDLLRKHNFSGEVAHAAGVASAKRSGNGFVDMFRGRLMFPIHDLQNRPIALGGRLIPEIAKRYGDNAGGKYINGRETLLFRKSQQLYGLQLARDSIRRDKVVMVMEGYTDVVAARQAGIEPVVAVLGTALGEQHVKILKRFADRVVLVLDGDVAGQTRADEVLELFVSAEVDMRVLTLPEGSDPADYITDHGREAFEKLVSEAPDALDHKLARLTHGIDFTRDTHAVTTAVDTMLKIVAKAPEGLRVDQLLVRLSKSFELNAERLERRLDVLRDEARRKSQGRRSSNSSVPASAPQSRQPQAPSSFDPNAAFNESADFDMGAYGDIPGGQSSFSQRPEPQSNSSRPMVGIDRKLFETLIECPDLAGTAVEAIDPDWLESNIAKMLLSAYQDLDLNGHSLDVDALLLLVENEQLKNEIVSLQDRVRDQEGKLPEGPEERYVAIMAKYHERASAAEKVKQIELLASAGMEQSEEDAMLKALFEAERPKHQIKND